MKRALAALLLGGISCQASLVYFELSPPGTDMAVGLSPSNEVPVVTNSTGSGGSISGGVVFDSSNLVLQVAIGYGSAAGFADLSGPPIGMRLHGPAPAGSNAAPLIDLLPVNFSATNPTNGGIIFGNLAFPTNSVSDLLSGLLYVNIETALNTNGEIRAQLIPVTNAPPASNSPPQVTCPADTTVECGVDMTYTAQVFQAQGAELTVVWSVNSVPVQTNDVPAQNPPTNVMVSFSGSLPLGTNLLTVTATEGASNSATCSATITVVDTTPPVIVSASASRNVLWPPNHKLVPVCINAVVQDECGPTSWQIISVTSNEATENNDENAGKGGSGNNGKGNGKGNGNGNGKGNGKGKAKKGGDNDKEPDWIITEPHCVKLRAERAGNSSGQIYSITIQATDAAGNVSSNVIVEVTVPHDQGKKKK